MSVYHLYLINDLLSYSEIVKENLVLIFFEKKDKVRTWNLKYEINSVL